MMDTILNKGLIGGQKKSRNFNQEIATVGDKV